MNDDDLTSSSNGRTKKKTSSIVYRYWCEPASDADEDILLGQIRLSAEYRRELALIENRSRVLWRARQGRFADSVRAEVRVLRTDDDKWEEIQSVLHPEPDVDPDDGDDGDDGGDDVSDHADDHDDRDDRDEDVTRSSMIDRLMSLGSGISRDAALLLVEEDMIVTAQSAARCAARADVVRQGLYWGTYQHAEDGASASFRSTPLHDDVMTSFSRVEGCVAVHLQPARRLVADDEWIRVGPVVRHGSEIDRSGRVRPARHREVKIRVGSTGRSPRWATVHVLMHREMPADGVVSWAVVKTHRVGSKLRWAICVTVGGSPAFGRSRQHADADRASCVGVDIGWRQVDGGVRVAYWWGSDGRSGEVVVPDRVLGADAKADSLRSIRDDNKNLIRDEIRAWVKSISALTDQELRERNEALELELRQRCEDFIEEFDLARHGAVVEREEVTTPTPSGAAVAAVRYRIIEIGKIGHGYDVVAPLVTAAPWITAETRSIHQWLRTSRFVRLVTRWRQDRVPGDEAIFARVTAWLKQDRHLWDWEAAARERRQRRVNEQIRVLAVRLSREYDRIGVEAPMVARMVKRPSRACQACTDATTTKCATCRDAERSRQLAARRVAHAAPARTREEIERFGKSYGAVVLRVNPAYTTQDCAHCGHRRSEVEDWTLVEIGCAACGVVEDQDLTAGKNICRIASATVLDEDGKPLASDHSMKSTGPKKALSARRNRKRIKEDRSRL